MTDYTHKMVRGTIIVLIMLILTAGIGYIFRLLLARHLSLHDFGLFFAVFNLVNLFFGFRSFGLGPACVRFITEARIKNDLEEVKRFFVILLLVQLVVAIIVLIGLAISSPWLSSSYFKDSNSGRVLLLVCLAFVFTPLITTFRLTFSAYRAMGFYASVEFMQVLFVAITTGIFIFAGFGLVAPAIGYVVGFALVVVVCCVMVLRLFPLFSIKTRLTKESFIRLVKFSVPVTVAVVLSSLTNSMETTLLTYFRPLEEVALFAVALPTASLLRFIPKAISPVILPFTSELHVTQHAGLAGGITRLYKYLFCVMLPFAIMFALYARDIVILLFGVQFAEAALAIQVLLVGSVFSAIALINQSILLGVNKPRMYSLSILLNVVVGAILGIFFIPVLGIVGAAISFSIAALIISIVSSFFVRSVLHQHMPWRAFSKVIFAGIVLFFVLLAGRTLIPLSFFIQAPILCSFGLVMYGSVCLSLRVITLTEAISLLRQSIGWKQ